jgi:hypothetical protein
VLDVFYQPIHAMIIKTQSIDHSIGFGNTKNSWGRITRLRPWCHCADFKKAKSQRSKRIQMFPILIQSRSKSDGIGKIQSHDVTRLTGNSCASQQSKLSGLFDSTESNAMSGFRVQFKKQRAKECVEHREFYPER